MPTALGAGARTAFLHLIHQFPVRSLPASSALSPPTPPALSVALQRTTTLLIPTQQLFRLFFRSYKFLIVTSHILRRSRARAGRFTVLILVVRVVVGRDLIDLLVCRSWHRGESQVNLFVGPELQASGSSYVGIIEAQSPIRKAQRYGSCKGGMPEARKQGSAHSSHVPTQLENVTRKHNERTGTAPINPSYNFPTYQT